MSVVFEPFSLGILDNLIEVLTAYVGELLGVISWGLIEQVSSCGVAACLQKFIYHMQSTTLYASHQWCHSTVSFGFNISALLH